jgi:hypothetical protein
MTGLAVADKVVAIDAAMLKCRLNSCFRAFPPIAPACTAHAQAISLVTSEHDVALLPISIEDYLPPRLIGHGAIASAASMSCRSWFLQNHGRTGLRT